MQFKEIGDLFKVGENGSKGEFASNIWSILGLSKKSKGEDVLDQLFDVDKKTNVSKYSLDQINKKGKALGLNSDDLNLILSKASDAGFFEKAKAGTITWNDALKDTKLDLDDIASGLKDTGKLDKTYLETIVRNGKFFTVGDTGAEFTKIKKGDIIFNHKQTEELFKNGYVTSGGGRAKAYGEAFVTGTAYASGGRLPTSTSSSSSKKKKTSSSTSSTKKSSSRSSTKSSSSSGSSSSKSSTSSNSSSSSSDSSKETKETLDWIETKLDRIKRDIDLIDKTA